LGEGGGRAGIAGPGAADGEVEDDIEFLIEGGGEGRGVGEPVFLGLVELAVDVPTDGAGLPLDGVYVEIVAQGAAGAFPFVAGMDVMGPFIAVVDGAEGGAWLVADFFEDVQFAAAGPSAVGASGGHHPEGGPDALAGGEFNPGLEAAVEPFALPLGGHAGGGEGVFLPLVFPPFDGGDDEAAVFDVGVAGIVGVIFFFAVASAFAVDLEAPFGGVDGGIVEFIRPDQLPVGIDGVVFGGVAIDEVLFVFEIELSALLGQEGEAQEGTKEGAGHEFFVMIVHLFRFHRTLMCIKSHYLSFVMKLQ